MLPLLISVSDVYPEGFPLPQHYDPWAQVILFKEKLNRETVIKVSDETIRCNIRKQAYRINFLISISKMSLNCRKGRMEGSGESGKPSDWAEG